MKKILLFLLLATITASAQGPLVPHKAYDFAESLLAEKEYYRAIGEFKRFLFIAPQDKLAATAQLQIGRCYYLGEQWPRALTSLQVVVDDYPNSAAAPIAHVLMANCFFQQHEYRLAISEIDNLLEDYPHYQLAAQAQLKGGVLALYDQDPKLAGSYFSQQNDPSLALAIGSYQDLPQKSPQLAGTLSAIMPGAGQLYAGRKTDALFAFMLNGLFIGGAIESFQSDRNVTGGLLTFFGLGWYTGNIYNAVNSTHKYNRRQQIGFIAELQQKYQVSFAGNSVRVEF